MSTKETTLQIDTKQVEKGLLKTKFVTEAKQIPQDNLTTEEKNVLDKCINKEEFTDEEFVLLKKTLQKYRPALDKLKPAETIENAEKTIKLIRTEQAFLDLMDSDEIKYLIVHLPTKVGELEFEFEVLPLRDSRIVEALDLQLDLFRDFTLEETALYASSAGKKDEELTPEEKEIITKINNELSEKISETKMEAVNNFLANQLIIRDSNADLETRLLFWDKFNFNAKFSVLAAVQKRLGLTEVDNRQLFPMGE